MGYHRTVQTLSELNSRLQTRCEEGVPLTLDIDGRPDYRILSFNPLAYEEYGLIRNRAPRIAGSLTLRAFLSMPHPENGTIIIAGVSAGIETYGFAMDGSDEDTRQTISDVAEALGLTGLRIKSCE